MKTAEPFDLLTSPLQGSNLIEAGAGTGKTYAITGLFLRLIIEQNLAVDQILVVTFTEAATEELKGRIRRRLQQAVAAFGGKDCTDHLVQNLVARQKTPATALRRLRAALRGFDQAAILTIHQFCRRILRENAYESGSLFDTELLTEEDDLRLEIAEDFWRRNLYRGSRLFVNYALTNEFSPRELMDLPAKHCAQPFLKILPPQDQVPDTAQAEKAFQKAFDRVVRNWPDAREEVAAILQSDPGLNRQKYKLKNVAVWLAGMDRCVASGGFDLSLFPGFEKFTSGELEASLKKGAAIPEHPFFEACEGLKKCREKLERLFRARLLSLQRLSLQYAREELNKRKGEQNVYSFDDLLLKVWEALESARGAKLANALRGRFRAALIDEFQDTDPVQYAIFRQIFGQGSGILFMIGDPKQAIYGFRGADIFAYLQARESAAAGYTLKANWRMQPELLEAVNFLFATHEKPFLYAKIPYQAAVPAENHRPQTLRIEGDEEPPLKIWLIDHEPGNGADKPLSKGEAREWICSATAAEVSRLLRMARENRALFGERSLQERDVAILVRTNAEARRMQAALTALEIPSVIFSTGNLFDTPEALEMTRLLAGAADPGREKALRTALSTVIIGLTGEDLEKTLREDLFWEKWVSKFRDLHELWRQRGFIHMFRSLLLQEKVLARLMQMPDGERRCTNWLHLAEVLHQAAVERRLSPAELVKWLVRQRDSQSPRIEEHQLRLESDAEAVQVVTVHKSKGLEFPVVFCPFLWSGSDPRRRKGPVAFHDEKDNMLLTLDLGSEEIEQHRSAAERELLAENLRLLYVALTRAISRCYFVWGRVRDAETSAPAYLFHQRKLPAVQDLVSTGRERFLSLSAEEIQRELRSMTDKAGGCISLEAMSSSVGRPYRRQPDEGRRLVFKGFGGEIDRRWRIASFTSLVTGLSHGAELPDRDAEPVVEEQPAGESREPEPLDPATGMPALPRGAATGSCLHDILENLDFTLAEGEQIEKLVAGKLQVYGLDSDWRPTVCRMVQKVLSVPLDPQNPDFQLQRIPPENRLNELEFFFPLKALQPAKLKRLLEPHFGAENGRGFPEVLDRLHFAPVKGFMKGFMDLIFSYQKRIFLVDWKSNFLGSRLADYRSSALQPVMQSEAYILQYLIYCVALDQFLRVRLPEYAYESHFGGVFYLFLRGMAPEEGPAYGVYRARPPAQLIRNLRESLLDLSACRGS